MKRRHGMLGVAVALAGGLATAVPAASAPTSDGGPCPKASALVTIVPLRDAVPAAKRAAGRGPWKVVELVRGPRGSLADSAAKACGRAVVLKSVFVQLGPSGRTCAAPGCEQSAYVVRYRRSGRYRIWFTGY